MIKATFSHVGSNRKSPEEVGRARKSRDNATKLVLITYHNSLLVRAFGVLWYSVGNISCILAVRIRLHQFAKHHWVGNLFVDSTHFDTFVLDFILNLLDKITSN